MKWPELFLVFVVAHLFGDYLVQTDWQARHKARGLSGDRVARRALCAHVVNYTLAFVPALAWMGSALGTGIAALTAIALSHLVVDDGRLLMLYLWRVKRCPDPVPPGLLTSVDQSVHLIVLWLVAVGAAAQA